MCVFLELRVDRRRCLYLAPEWEREHVYVYIEPVTGDSMLNEDALVRLHGDS